MSNGYYLENGAHMLITGATGAGDEYGGKTVLANWLCERSVTTGTADMGVFWNPKGHTFVRGVEVHTLGELAQSYRDGARLFNVVPSGMEHTEIIETLRMIPGEKLFVHDEAHAVGDTDSADWCFRQGGNVGNGTRFRTGDIRSIAVTQHPWDLPESVSQNCPLMVWVGPKTKQAKRYFNTMQIPEAYESIPDADPYHWSVIDAGEYVETNAPVPKEYANQ